MSPDNLIGSRFGEWTILSFYGKNVKGAKIWTCRCSCGFTKPVPQSILRQGTSTKCLSCSYKVRGKNRQAYPREALRLNGIWRGIKQRCNNPKRNRYSNYGGKGIKMCSIWENDFIRFMNDVGLPPSPKHSIDRFPNKNGNYEPGNVRWATDLEQANNTNRNVFIEINGIKDTIAGWSRRTGINKGTLWSRLQSISPEKAIIK